MATTQATIFKRYVDSGLPTPEDFVTQEVPAPTAADATDGKVVIDLVYVSVDPYMRGRMRGGKSYIPPFTPGQPIASLAVARVLHGNDSLPAGALVWGLVPWQQVQAVPTAALNRIPEETLKQLGLPASVYLNTLGMVGLTSYGSLATIAKAKAGETVFVSGAAGAVGLIVGQLFKNVYGCRVVGSAGSDDKVKFLLSVGYDAAFNYKTTAPADGLKEHCPQGIDVYFDNVGGETLEAALDAANLRARVVACGSISQYNTPREEAYGVRNLFNVVGKRLLIQGFISSDFAELRPKFEADMTQYLKEGKVKNVEHLVPGGLTAAGPAFLDMMRGGNLGKVVVQVGDDPLRATA